MPNSVLPLHIDTIFFLLVTILNDKTIKISILLNKTCRLNKGWAIGVGARKIWPMV